MRFFPSVTFNNTQRKVFLVAGLIFLAAGALLVARWGGTVTTAAVLCGLGPCTASTANTSLSAAQGTVEFNTPATLTWHATNVENTVPGVTCFGKNEVSPCGTPYQILYPGKTSDAKWTNYLTLDTDTYLSVGIDSGAAVLYKWMGPTQPYSESSPLPVDVNGGIMDSTMFDRSFSLDPGETVKSVVVYITTPPPNGALGIKIGRRSKVVGNTWTVVAEQGCSVTGYKDSWYECVFTTPFIVPSNDSATESYHVGSYVNANGGPLGAGATPVLASYKSGSMTVANGTLTNKYTEGTFDTNFMRVVYNRNTDTGTPCFGNGSACEMIFQTFATGASNTRNPIRSVVISDTPYLIISQDGANSKVYKWLGSCFGAGSTCGSVFQDLGVASSKAKGGIKPFMIGSDTYAALGSWGSASGIYKWMGSCFGDGTTCGAFYQTVGGNNAKGGWEPFKEGTDTYLALANDAVSSELYEWMPAATTLGTQGGLTGEYFNNTTLSGTPVLTRQEAVNFNWGTLAPDPSVPVDGFSVRWSGTVVAPVTGPYNFYMGSDDGERLYVDGNLVTSEWSNHSFNTKTSNTINLTAGQQVPIVAEYYESTNTARVELSWSYTGQVKTIIPASALYSGYTHPACAGDGRYCGVPVQSVGAYADSSTNGGWHAFKIGTETFLAFASDGANSRLFKFKTSTEPFEASDFSNIAKTGDAGNTIFDRSWRVDNNRTVDKISLWSTTYQTNAYVKLAKRTGTGTYSVLVSTQCTLQPNVWTDCDIANFTTDASSEYYAGGYSPTALGQTSFGVPRAKASGSNSSGNVTLLEDTNNAISVRVIYAEPPAPITPCIGNGYTCGVAHQDFASTNHGTFGWDTMKVGADTYLVSGQTLNPSPMYRWMNSFKCFGNGSTCGTSTQNLDGGGSSLTPVGASFKFMPLSGKAYLASSAYNEDTKVYKGTDISSVYITVNPSLTASTTRVYWSAANVTNCSVTGPGLSWGPYATTSVATTSKMTTIAPNDGDSYSINCTTASGAKSATSTAYVRSNFWDANQVYHDGVWPMESSTCATDGQNYTDCFKGNEFVSKKYGATAIFGAHAQGIGVGTILGYFGGHGPLASQGGGFEYTKTWSGPQFPDPSINEKPEYHESVVVPAGGKVELEWMCMNDQNQKIQNGCVDEWWSDFCGDSHDSYHAYYSDSTVSSSTLSSTNWTGGALYGKRVVTVNQDVTYNLQCVGHAFGSPVTYPVTSIDLYVEGSPNIPNPPQDPASTSGCTVYSYDSVNGTTTIAYGNDSPVGGFTTNNLVRNTTFTLSCTIEGDTVEESSIRVLIPPVVSVVSTGNASEPTPLVASAFDIYLEDALDYPLTINYTLGGTAVNGTDYQTIPLTATIYPGQQSTSTVIIPIDDLSYEGNETVELTLASGTGYRVVAPVSATTTIIDRENAQSLPTGPFVACGGTASSTCELAVYPQQVRLGSQTRVSWYVDGLIKGENDNPGDTCKVEASPTGSWSLPTFSIGAGNIWSGGASTTINSRTTFTLTCTAPDGTTNIGVSKTVNIIPSFDEI